MENEDSQNKGRQIRMLDQSNHQDNLLSSISEIIRKLTEEFVDSTYIYRGEPAHFPIICSSLYREYQDIETDSFDIETVQQDIIVEAKKYTSETDDFKILTEIQRYGGKTNLIEFTTDYLIAIFFSCTGSPDQDGRIILQKTEKIKETIYFPRSPGNHASIQKIVYVRPPKGYIQLDTSDVITIPRNIKQYMLEYLQKTHGISAETIYNDLYGYVMSHSTHQSVYTEFHRGLTWQQKGVKLSTPEEKQNAFEKAIRHYSNALTLKSDDANTYYNRGNSYFYKGESERAISDYTKTIELKPDHADAYFARGLSHFNKIEYDEAIEDYNTTIKLEPGRTETYYNRGLIYFNKGEYDKAIEDYNTTIELEPDFAKVYNNRGLAYLNKSEYNTAIKNFNMAIKLNPEIAEVYNNRGIAYKNIGEHDLASRDYNTVMRLKTDDDLNEAEVKRFLDLMKLQFDEAISSEPYYRIFAVPITMVSDAVPTQESKIHNLLQNPPGVRKGGFGFVGIQEVIPIPDGICGSNYGEGEVILLNNGFLELRCPLSDSLFQWQISAFEMFRDSEWLYPYVVCEFPVTFLRLVKAIYTAANVDSRILVQQEYHNLSGFLLVGRLPGDPKFGKSENDRRVYESPHSIISKQTVDINFHPDRVAYDFVTDVYTHFGVSMKLMPNLFDEKYNFSP